MHMSDITSLSFEMLTLALLLPNDHSNTDNPSLKKGQRKQSLCVKYTTTIFLSKNTSKITQVCH